MSETHHTRHILLVEDSSGVTRALARALSLYQDGIYQVEACGSGEAALKSLLEAPFDLLITDLRLPGLDGLELVKRARQLAPLTRTLLITAYGSPEVEQNAHSLGAAYLPKPFHLGDLVHVVEKALSEPSLPAPSPCPPEAELEPSGRTSLLREAIELAGVSARRKAHLIILASDLDGTLSDGRGISPQTWEALRAAKMGGLVLILVTGRTLDSFITGFPCKELCEAIVAENGAVVYFPRIDTVHLPFGSLDPALLHQIEASGIPLERGMAIAATWTPHDEKVMRVLRGSKHSVTLEYNRDAVMLLPPGASKGSGLLAALHELGYSSHNLVVCGDAENDRSLFEPAELSVAVANAQPALKSIASVVLDKPDGEGVQGLVQDLLEGRTPARAQPPAHPVLLGYRMSGSPLHLDPFTLVESNLGIFGSSGSGKSWLAGLIAEELLRQKYQVCIIDPEGDYRSLGASPHTLLMGGPNRQLPDVQDVINILEQQTISLILDLSMYALEQRTAYLSGFLPALHSLRSRRGRPHFLLIDEIQSFCPPEGGLLTEPVLEGMRLGGISLVSYRISQIAPPLLADLDHVLLTCLRLPEEMEAIQPYLPVYPGSDTALEQLCSLPTGQAYLCRGKDGDEAGAQKELIRFRAGPRAAPHIRHLHKYLRALLPVDKRFYFHNSDGRLLGRVSANLWEFRSALGEVPLDSLQYHLERGDFEHWLQDVMHDEELARRVHKVGGRGLVGEDLRRALQEVVIDRYDELETLL